MKKLILIILILSIVLVSGCTTRIPLNNTTEITQPDLSEVTETNPTFVEENNSQLIECGELYYDVWNRGHYDNVETYDLIDYYLYSCEDIRDMILLNIFPGWEIHQKYETTLPFVCEDYGFASYYYKETFWDKSSISNYYLKNCLGSGR